MEYILLRNRVGYTLERNMSSLDLHTTESTPTEVQAARGQLLRAVPQAQQPKDSDRIALVGIERKSLHLECRRIDVNRLLDDDANLLLGISSTESRFDTYMDRGSLPFGRQLLPGSAVFVQVKGTPNYLPGIVRYKGELTFRGTWFGVELTENPGFGTTNGEFKNKRYFTCEPGCGVFVALDKLTPRDDAADLKSQKPAKKDKTSRSNFKSRGKTKRDFDMFEAFVPTGTVLPEKHFDDKPQKETTANETPGKKDPVEGKIVKDGRYARPRIRSLIQELSEKHFGDKPQKETTANETPGKKNPVEGKIVQDGRYARPRIRSLIQELSEQQGACLPSQSLEIGQDQTKQQELEGKQDTSSNRKIGQKEEWTGNLEMQAASVQHDMTNCKDELSHREAETAPLYRQLTEVMERNDYTEDEHFGLSGFVGRGFSGLEAGLYRTTTHQNNGKLEQVLLVKEEQETVVNNAIQETEEQKETIDRQSSSVEDDLRTFQAEVSTATSELHEELKEEWQQNGNLRTDFTEIEKRLREELTRTEIRVALLSKLLTTKHQQVENFQRQLKKMKQQLTVKEERKENFRTQLEKEQRLRVELTEKETIETRPREQLREKDHQEANFSRRLTEMEQQLAEKEEQDETLRKQVRETEQRLREEITEKDVRETELREQITEKDQKLREMKQQLTKKEEREENLQTQRRQMEQQLTEKEERVENLRTNLRETEERLTQKVEQEESLRINLRQTEQRMREELTEKETKETELREQLREMDHQVFNFQRRTREMEQQFTEKEEQEEILRTQLRETERQLREETTEKEARESELSEQLRKRDQQLREMEQQLAEKEKREETLRTQLRIHAMEQRLREEMTEETRETGLREQLRERDQQVANFEGRMREMERQLTEKEERKENLQTQLREMAQRLTERETRETGLREQLRERDQQVTNFEGRMREMQQQFRAENANLQQQVAELEDRVGSESNNHDWVISRDEIQMTDKSLGVGGWGEVFEGRYCGCAVAVKRIHEAIISPHNQGLFQREIDIASRCRHPCLLQFIGATNDEEMPLFVTELMESNLRQLLEERQRRRRLSKTEITVISLDVARALNYLHQKKPDPIIHRDVSSANVLLWRQGDRWRGKVSDYGTAKFEEQCMSIVPGCFAYSAPEVQKSSDQTVKIDVYSFGVLLCEMCIKEFPDPQKREQQLAMVTDRKLLDLIRRCLQSVPRYRPNMEEIINELEQFNKTS